MVADTLVSAGLGCDASGPAKAGHYICLGRLKAAPTIGHAITGCQAFDVSSS